MNRLVVGLRPVAAVILGWWADRNNPEERSYELTVLWDIPRIAPYSLPVLVRRLRRKPPFWTIRPVDLIHKQPRVSECIIVI